MLDGERYTPEEILGEFRAGMKGSVLDGRRGSCSKDIGSAFFSWLHEVESKVEGWHGDCSMQTHVKIASFTGEMRRQGTGTVFLKVCSRNTDSARGVDKKVL